MRIGSVESHNVRRITVCVGPADGQVIFAREETVGPWLASRLFPFLQGRNGENSLRSNTVVSHTFTLKMNICHFSSYQGRTENHKVIKLALCSLDGINDCFYFEILVPATQKNDFLIRFYYGRKVCMAITFTVIVIILNKLN